MLKIGLKNKETLSQACYLQKLKIRLVWFETYLKPLLTSAFYEKLFKN